MRYRISLILLIGFLLCGCNRDYYKIGDRKLRIYTDLNDLPKPDKVRAIKLEGQGLESFPTKLYKYENLEYLNLRNNNISKLPDNIKIFKKLYGLYLDDNPLKELPDSIVTLSNLKALTTNGTDIFQFPKEFQRLTNLKGMLVGRMPKLSNEEIQKLEKAMPWCNFVRSVD